MCGASSSRGGWGVRRRSLGQAKKKDALVRWEDPSLRERLTAFYGIDSAFDWDALFVRESSAHVRASP